ncbi:MAG: hypothetical protein H6Q67_2182 [Firmicutes bacterium]|nr:hypothetical protein [Bacillota bacterium]
MQVGHLTNIQRDNIKYLLQTHTQIKHFKTLPDDFAKGIGKGQVIENVLNSVDEGKIDFEEFKSWLALHQINGNNSFYVYELRTHTVTEGMLRNLQTYIGSITYDITGCSVDNLKETVLVNFFLNVEEKRGIFTFLSPATVMKKVRMDNTVQYIPEKQIYYANVIVDYGLGWLIVSINPTTNMISVDNNEKNKNGFEPIANYYLVKMRDIIGEFTIKTPNWVPQALDLLAEEGTHHNNPEITAEYMKAIPCIEDTVVQLLSDFELDDPSALAYVSEEFKLAFESVLIDKYGVNEEATCSFRVFELKGDQHNSVVYVGAKVGSLNEGRVAKVAKATRANADLTQLGIEYNRENDTYRFYISLCDDYYLIKSNSTKFTNEGVIRDVIIKLGEYKEQIQSIAIGKSTD